MVSSISIKERMGEVVNRQAKERDDYTKSKPTAPFAQLYYTCLPSMHLGHMYRTQ